jgi:hypothetical protein
VTSLIRTLNIVIMSKQFNYFNTVYVKKNRETRDPKIFVSLEIRSCIIYLFISTIAFTIEMLHTNRV